MKAILHYRKTLALLLLLGMGVAKLPFEEKITEDLQARNLMESPPDLGMVESLGQMGAAASLGGLRSLVASILYLEAYGAFEDVDWARVDSLMTLATRLQPHEPIYWEEAAWHMAYNAASNVERDKTLPPLLRAKMVKDYIQRGVDIMEEGLHFLPDEPRLYLRLALIDKDRLKDPRKAAQAFFDCYEHGGPDYAQRMGAYELTELNEHAADEKAYKILKMYYDLGMKKKGTTIMVDLPKLEERLGIPKDQRCVPHAEDDKFPANIKAPRPVEPEKKQH